MAAASLFGDICVSFFTAEASPPSHEKIKEATVTSVTLHCEISPVALEMKLQMGPKTNYLGQSVYLSSSGPACFIKPHKINKHNKHKDMLLKRTGTCGDLTSLV